MHFRLSLPSNERQLFSSVFPTVLFLLVVLAGEFPQENCFIQRYTVALDGAESGHAFCKSVIMSDANLLSTTLSSMKESENIRLEAIFSVRSCTVLFAIRYSTV